MKLLLDQCLPRSTAVHLATAGMAVEHVAELGMSGAADVEILDLARDSQAVIVTLDADFQRILALSRATAPSVVRVRIEGLNGKQMAAVVNQAVTLAATELTQGAVVSVSPSRIRVRLLPIGN